MIRISLLTSILLVLAAAAAANAAPVQWTTAAGGNGHYYAFIVNINNTWTDANVAAAAQTFNGMNGYLATVTSAGESAFLASQFPERTGSDQNGWLGGYQDLNATDYSEPAGGWRWVTGEPMTYTNWFRNSNSTIVEPDNYQGHQDFMKENVGFAWDDAPNVDPTQQSIQGLTGYFVEFGTVPEPGSLGTIAGLALLSCIRRRQS